MIFNPREWHHLYPGLVLLVFGVVLQWPLLWVPGMVLVVDDVVEHACGVGVLRWIYGQTLWRIPWVRRLNAWLDTRFG